MIKTHDSQRRELLASFDEHMVQIHSNIQKDMTDIPRPIGHLLEGQFFIPAVSEDGKQLALAESRRVQEGATSAEYLRILVYPLTERGLPAPGTVEPIALSLEGIPEAWVVGMTISPRGKYLAATVLARGTDTRSTFMWVLIWDLETTKVVEKILVSEEFVDPMRAVFSRDDKTLAILTKDGHFTICTIGACAAKTESQYRKGRIETVWESGRGQETLDLVDLVARDDNSFLAIYSAKENLLSAYRLTVEKNGVATEEGDIILQPHEKLPHMGYLVTDELKVHYCYGADTLIAVDKRDRLLAWTLSGGGAPECTIRFPAGSEKSVAAIREIPKGPVRWNRNVPYQRMSQAGYEEALLKKWEGKIYEARMTRTDDALAAFRFPSTDRVTLEHHALDGKGEKLITLIVKAGQNQQYNAIIAIWNIFSGHHIAQLAARSDFRSAEDDLMQGGAVGYDTEAGRFLLRTPKNDIRDVYVASFPRVKPRGKITPATGAYRYDEGNAQFIAEADGKKIKAQVLPATLAVMAEKESVDGGADRLKVTLTDPGSGKTTSFYPNLLWKHGTGRWEHNEGKLPFGIVSPDGHYAAISVPGSATRTRFDSEPALEVWDVKTGELKARVTHKSKVVTAAFLDGYRYLAAVTIEHGAWLSIWHPEDLGGEVCGRLRNYDLVEVGKATQGDDDACS